MYWKSTVELNTPFFQGTPDAPRCGFSNAVVQILRMHGVEYNAHNVLDDEAVRQGEFWALHSCLQWVQDRKIIVANFKIE